MYCEVCQKKLDTSSKFCPSCGNKTKNVYVQESNKSSRNFFIVFGCILFVMAIFFSIFFGSIIVSAIRDVRKKAVPIDYNLNNNYNYSDWDDMEDYFNEYFGGGYR